MTYKENTQTLDCCELCSLVRDKIIIGSPSRPNPQAACRIMIGAALTHLFCILPGTQHSQHTDSCIHKLQSQQPPQPRASRGGLCASPPLLWKHILYNQQLCTPPTLSNFSFLYLFRRHFPPTHTCKGLRHSVNRLGWLVASWALICW